jgi:asparagine synthase (glutamine-hydrolysing)
MCGIAGFVSRSPRSSAPIRRMTALARHRGPDDEGYLLVTEAHASPRVFGGADTPDDAYRSETPFAPAASIDAAGDAAVVLALGHRRLSIVDLSVLGHQPMCTSDRRLWIVYNGEIYNYRELSEELAARGHRFRSHSDTEVILAAYAQWGPACQDRFNGMWAFAIYDARERELFLSRDRFGIKPLYYWCAPDQTLYFASEIKQFTAAPEWTAEINPQRAYDFLAWGVTDHTDETMFARVYQLRAGECARLPIATVSIGADGRVPVSRWYDLRPAAFSGSFDAAAEECAALLTDSVRLMLRADVAVGSCLSGGIDSSSIVCVMNRLLREQDAAALQMTFSACADAPQFDERKWIEQVVKATGVDARYVCPSLDRLMHDAADVAWYQDEPYGSTSIYAQWSVFRLAAEHGVKVLLDGQGADEAFAGYHSFFPAYFASFVRAGRLAALRREMRATNHLHGRQRRITEAVKLLLPAASQSTLRARIGASSVPPSWLNVRALGAAPRDPLAETRYAPDVEARSRDQITTSNLPMLLHWEDRDAMAHSVESRVPFLDHRLVEFALGLPDDFKLGGGVTKRVVRSGMSGMLPDAIRDRVDKMAFVTPEEQWLRTDGGSAFRSRMRDAMDASRGIVDARAGAAVLDDILSGRQPFSTTPWRLIAFGDWMKAFAVAAA